MGKTIKGLLVVAVALVVIVGGRAIYGVMHPANDKVLIQTALADSIKASQEGRPGGVMDKLSANLKYNGENEGGNEREIARFIRDSKPEIKVENPEPIVTGDEATIVSPVDLNLSMLGMSQSRRIKEATIIFRKEDDRDWIIFPSRRWKLAEVRINQDAVADLIH